LAHLAEADADLARAIELVGTPPSRARPPGFGTLLQIIVGQQLSTASAEAIWRRLVAAVEPLTPEGFLALDDDSLRTIGFSRQKVLYGRGLAQMVAEGRVDLEALARQPDEAVITALVAIRGFGRWSAEVYLCSASRDPMCCRPTTSPFWLRRSASRGCRSGRRRSSSAHSPSLGDPGAASPPGCSGTTTAGRPWPRRQTSRAPRRDRMAESAATC
jgi:3-methyladenine DNA glycosylase/8-oxoguanine DNA glycosylase